MRTQTISEPTTLKLTQLTALELTCSPWSVSSAYCQTCESEGRDSAVTCGWPAAAPPPPGHGGRRGRPACQSRWLVEALLKPVVRLLAVLPVDLFNFSESSSVFLPGRRPRLSLAFTGRLQQPFEFESSQPLTRNTDTAWVSDHNWLGPARRGSGQPESLTR